MLETPWEFEEDPGGAPYRIADSPWYQGSIIIDDAAVADIRQRDHSRSRTPEEARAIGQRIVRAVNAHEALVQALEDQIELWEMAKPMLDLADARQGKVKFTEMFDPIGHLRAALKLARGEG